MCITPELRFIMFVMTSLPTFLLVENMRVVYCDVNMVAASRET